MKGLFQSRKFRQGSLATAIAVVVIALVIVINLVASTLTDRYSLTVDLTPEKLFSITDETKEYLSGLDRDVTVYVMSSEEDYAAAYLQVLEVLKKYALQSPRISLEFVDVVANPAFAQNYPNLQLSTYSILIVCGDKVRDIASYELYDYESTMYGSYPVASAAEQVLTSAILAVTSESTVNVAVVTGHNETDPAAFTSLLGSNNYLTDQVNLVTGNLDPAFSVAVISAPSRDFTEDELKRLDTFLENGGRYGKTLLYLASSEGESLPNLEAFLADWGITVEPGVVYESDANRYIPGYPYIAQLDFAEDVYSERSQAEQLYPFAAYARPLRQAYDSKGSVTTEVLLQFSATSGIIRSEEDIQEPDGSPIPYAILSRSTSYVGGTPLQSQVVAVGSSSFVEDFFLSTPSFANSAYMLDLLADLTGKEEGVRIQSKSLSGSPLTITSLQAIVIGLVLAIVLPLVLLITGITIWLRRRHR